MLETGVMSMEDQRQPDDLIGAADVEAVLLRCVHPHCNNQERRHAEAQLAVMEERRGFWFALIEACERVSLSGDAGGPFAEAARLLGAVIAKNSVARAVQRDRKQTERSWSRTNPVERDTLERACAHAALLEPSDKASTQLTLLLATICRGETRRDDDSLGAAPRIMTSLAGFAISILPNSSAPFAGEWRPWLESAKAALAVSRIPPAIAARRALRCLKHCVRSCVDEVRELETIPSAAVLGSAALHDKTALPPSSNELQAEISGGAGGDIIVVSSSLTSRDLVLVRARDALMRAQVKRERRMAGLVSSAAILTTVACRTWTATAHEVGRLEGELSSAHVTPHGAPVTLADEQRRNQLADEIGLSCRWLRCLETLVFGIKSLADVARRTAFLAVPPGDRSQANRAAPASLASSDAILLPAFGGSSDTLVAMLASTVRSCQDAKLARLSSETLQTLVDARCVKEASGTKAALHIASIFADEDAFSTRLQFEQARAIATIRCVGKLALEDYEQVSPDRLDSFDKSNDDMDGEKDPMELLCDSATSLEISDAPTTSSGGRLSREISETSPLISTERRPKIAGQKSAIIDMLVHQTSIVEALVRRYFALSPAELQLCVSGNSELLYAAECRAVGSSASASWNASASLFSSVSSRRLTRESPSLADESAIDDPSVDGFRVEEVRPIAEALVVALCIRSPSVVSRAILTLCDTYIRVADFVVVDACYRAIGLVAPLLPLRCDRAFINFADFWRSHVERILVATPQTYPPHSDNGRGLDAMARARGLWLVSRFRRTIFHETVSGDPGTSVPASFETSLLASVLQATLAHANPKAFLDGRLALSAVDALCSLLETAIERHRGGALYARRIAELAKRQNEARRDDEAEKLGRASGAELPFRIVRSASDDLCPSSSDTNAITSTWRMVVILRTACTSIAERAVSVAQEAQTPEGFLRCLQCVALCLEAASLDDFTIPVLSREFDTTNAADEAVLTELMVMLSRVIGGELVLRAWNFTTVSSQEEESAGRFSASKIRGAILCLLTNALKAARRRGAPDAVAPLRNAALTLIRAVVDLGGDQTLLAEDTFALWLEVLRACIPQQDISIDNQLKHAFVKLVANPSSLAPVGPEASLMTACAHLESRELTIVAGLNAGTSERDTVAALYDVVVAPLLTVVQGYLLLYRDNDMPLVAAGAGLTLCVFSKVRALELQLGEERSPHSTDSIRSSPSGAYPAMLDDDGATVLAAFVVAELLLHTRGSDVILSCPPFAKAMRLATTSATTNTALESSSQVTGPTLLLGRLLNPSAPGCHRVDGRFTDARVALISRAIMEAHGDAFLACGFGPPTQPADASTVDTVRSALAFTFEHAARRTLDDLAIIASSRGSAPPPRRVVMASLAAAAALANERSAEVVWASLPMVLRLWARCLYEMRRAADRCDSSNPQQKKACESLRAWKLPLVDDEENGHLPASMFVDNIASAARQLQRNDVLHGTSLIDAARHALAMAAPSRGGAAALQSAAEQVNPPDLRNTLIELLS